MTTTLKTLFIVMLLALVACSTWASLQTPLWEIPPEVARHPWYLTTVLDTYLTFFTVWLWVAYKERTPLARALWLLLIFGLGGIAIAAYLLIQLWRLPRDAGIDALLLKRRG